MAKQTEVASDIRAATELLQKIGNESALTLQKVSDLEAVIAQGNEEASPEVSEALAALKAQATAVDDLVPDAEPGVIPE